ncbi:MAG TPA: hypothetical protein VL978_16385 [Puia sp.]|nr:hypothetical protein [Puia sp.]
MDRSATSRRPEVLPTNFQSILYAMGPPSPEQRDLPTFFVHLNLDQVVDAATKSRTEYDLKPFFYLPPRSVEDVLYRQAVGRDLDNPAVLVKVQSFAEGMGRMRQRLPDPEKSFYKYQRERYFLEAADLYCRAVGAFAQDLALLDYDSAGLRALQAFLEKYTASDAFQRLLADKDHLLADLSAIEYGIFNRELEVQVRRKGPEPDYTAEIERLFGKFRRPGTGDSQPPRGDPRPKTKEYVWRGKVETYTVANERQGEQPRPEDMNHVEAAILEGVATLFPEIFGRLDEFCERHANFRLDKVMAFDREIQFYLAWMDYISPLKAAGLPFCYPEITATDKDIFVTDGFDVALGRALTEEKRAIVLNDFHLSGQERIIVVTGPNQGGKTTFSRMYGQLHYLGALGLPVPGSAAKLFFFDRLFTHFERAEHAGELRSKLEDDLVRLHEILTGATARSIVILNEILSSATLQDAIYLSGKIMERLDALDTLCVWVTFIDEIIAASPRTISMVSRMDPADPTARTFKIVRQQANGLAYAQAIAEKYRVTYEALKNRLP